MLCKLCNKKIESKRAKLYCSRNCSDRDAKNISRERNYKPKNCIRCGSITHRRKYCIQCCKQTRLDFNKKRSGDRQKKLNIKLNKLKRVLLYVKGFHCCKCGYNKNLSSLTFHHIDETKKSFTLDTKNLQRRPIEQIIQEIDKCEVLCQNCHILHHQKIRDSRQSSRFYNKQKYIARKLELMKINNSKCKYCNLEFCRDNMHIATHHHLHDKKFNINCSSLIGKNIDLIKSEITKCELVCANCHMEIHNSD